MHITMNTGVLIKIFVGIIATAALAGYWTNHHETVPQTRALPSGANTKATLAQPAAAGQTNNAIALPGDVEVPDELRTDAAGHLLVERGTRDVYDFFLLSGLTSKRTDGLARLLAYLRNKLAEPARAEALRLAQAYVEYMDAHDKLVAGQARAQAGDMHALASFLHQRTLLRQQKLGYAVAQAWFGSEEQDAELALQRARIMQDNSLSEEGKHRRIAALGGQETRPDALQDVTHAVTDLRTQGAAPEQIRARIAQSAGEEAARRYDQQQQEEDAWQSRYRAYRQQASQIESSASLDSSERTRRLNELRHQQFPLDNEALRAESLDSVGTAGH